MINDNSNQNKIVVFSQDTAPIILDILDRYGLNEKDSDLFRKLKERKPFNSGILLKTTENIILGKLDKVNAVEYLKTNLNSSPETATKITDEIYNLLLPIGRIATQEDLDYLRKKKEKEKLEEIMEDGKNENEDEGSHIKPLGAPIGVQNAINSVAEKPREEISIPRRIEPLKPVAPTAPQQVPQPQQSQNKNDSYREPIE